MVFVKVVQAGRLFFMVFLLACLNQNILMADSVVQESEDIELFDQLILEEGGTDSAADNKAAKPTAKQNLQNIIQKLQKGKIPLKATEIMFLVSYPGALTPNLIALINMQIANLNPGLFNSVQLTILQNHGITIPWTQQNTVYQLVYSLQNGCVLAPDQIITLVGYPNVLTPTLVAALNQQIIHHGPNCFNTEQLYVLQNNGLIIPWIQPLVCNATTIVHELQCGYALSPDQVMHLMNYPNLLTPTVIELLNVQVNTLGATAFTSAQVTILQANGLTILWAQQNQILNLLQNGGALTPTQIMYLMNYPNLLTPSVIALLNMQLTALGVNAFSTAQLTVLQNNGLTVPVTQQGQIINLLKNGNPLSPTQVMYLMSYPSLLTPGVIALLNVQVARLGLGAFNTTQLTIMENNGLTIPWNSTCSHNAHHDTHHHHHTAYCAYHHGDDCDCHHHYDYDCAHSCDY